MARSPNYISEVEKDIQDRSSSKDKGLKIKGLKKDYIFDQGKFKIYEVDGEWIRNNLYVNYGTGGHGKVHSFIPNNEVWIEKNKKSEYKARTIIHEINEFKKMNKLPYYHAHKNSMKVENNSSQLKEILHKVKLSDGLKQAVET